MYPVRPLHFFLRLHTDTQTHRHTDTHTHTHACICTNKHMHMHMHMCMHKYMCMHMACACSACMQEAVDTDDGSAFYKTYENFFVYAANGLKSDFNGRCE